ncbi:MAG TPA: N-acetylmuramoyl-L-alanine amidase [Candidatus Didemnitutus sp.]|nr:N-acetylmuramoyl-L-alanine amidase [Candidatus Didemnitutus sp.]
MPRILISRWLALAAFLLVHLGCTAAQSASKNETPAKTETPPAKSESPAAPATPAPVRAAPTRPAPVWPTTQFRGADYVDIRDVAARFGLKTVWTRPAQTVVLKNGNEVRFTFDLGQRDFYFDSLRIFLGERPQFEKDTLWLAKLDVIKVVAPLFRPIDQLAQFSATTPKTIVLDPGHGGSDPGTENAKVGVNEKTNTLDVALRLKKLLELRGWRVLMVRDKDVELSKNKKIDLAMRADFANKNNADLFLSIHFNSAPQSISGVETFVLPSQFMLSTSDENGDDMTKTSFPGNRFDFANVLLGEKLHRALRSGLKIPDRGFKRQRFAVLRTLECPGALVECGYLSNDAEARRVGTAEFRQQIAESLADGLDTYVATLAAMRTPPATEQPAVAGKGRR